MAGKYSNLLVICALLSNS
jgi:hypothetical protein